jgi:hypothetical protein
LCVYHTSVVTNEEYSSGLSDPKVHIVQLKLSKLWTGRTVNTLRQIQLNYLKL